MSTNLTIEKTREYVWRIGPFGNRALSSHNWITAWHVVDADSGKRIAGGHSQGNNSQSGYARISRRKDARGFIAGYLAAERGEVVFKGMHNYPSNARDLLKTRDEQELEHFIWGAQHFLESHQ